MSRAPDPMVQRRQRIRQLVATAKRLGYAMLLLSILGFAAGVATDFSSWSVALTIVALVTAIVVLPVPIVLGYGLRAAEREDRARGST